MLALTPFTSIRAVNAVRDSLPKQWKDKFSTFEEMFQIFTSNLKDMHSAFIRIEERMRRENLQRMNDPHFVPNMIIYKDLNKSHVNYTSNQYNSNYRGSSYRSRRRGWNSRGNYPSRGGYSRGTRGRRYYSNNYNYNWNNRGSSTRRGSRGSRGRGTRGRGRNFSFETDRSYNNTNNSNSGRLPRYINKQCYDCKLGGHLAQFHSIFALPQNTKTMFEYHQKWCKENGTNVINFMNNPANNSFVSRNINNSATNSNTAEMHAPISNSNFNSRSSSVNRTNDNRSALAINSSFYDDPIETHSNRRHDSSINSRNNNNNNNSNTMTNNSTPNHS